MFTSALSERSGKFARFKHGTDDLGSYSESSDFVRDIGIGGADAAHA